MEIIQYNAGKLDRLYRKNEKYLKLVDIGKGWESKKRQFQFNSTNSYQLLNIYWALRIKRILRVFTWFH